MSGGPLLVPNLGAEEGVDWRQARLAPQVAAAARLWRWLFAADAEVAGPRDEAWDAWPPDLVGSRDAPAFDWLRGSDCYAWLADDGAARLAADAGRGSVHGPGPETVLRVHDKAFAQRAARELGLVPRHLEGTTRVFEPRDLERVEEVRTALHASLADWPDWLQGRFTLKPRLGTSGRGRFDASLAELDGARLAAALPRLAARGGAVLEPWLERVDDFSVQLCIEKSGELRLLGSLGLASRRSGGYRGHRGEIDSRGRVFSGAACDERLREAAAGVAGAARDAGYFGVAGIDAFRFRGPGSDGPILRPIVELNARFTMGTVVIGLVRRLLARAREVLDLVPGERRSFRFELDAPAEGWEAAREAAGPGALFVALGRDGDAVAPGILFFRSREAA